MSVTDVADFGTCKDTFVDDDIDSPLTESIQPAELIDVIILLITLILLRRLKIYLILSYRHLDQLILTHVTVVLIMQSVKFLTHRDSL